jgi:hypothetical protein
MMNTGKAISEAYRLHEKWVSMADIRNGKGYDLNRIHASMLSEHRANRKRPARCTPACAKETIGELILLGKIRKALS